MAQQPEPLMPRYVVRTDLDPENAPAPAIEVASTGEIRSQAVAYLGELLRDLSDDFWERGLMSLTVEDETGLVLIRLDIAGTMAPALARPGSASATRG